MGSANFQHHHLQDQLLDSSPSSYGVFWPQQHPTSLNGTRDNNFNNNPHNNIDEGAIINTRPLDSNSPNMAQDHLGFQWTHCTNTTAGVTFTGNGRNQSPHDMQLERIKEEFSETYPKFTDMINSSPTSSIEDLHLHPSSYIKNQQQQRDFNGLNQLPSGGGDFMFYSNSNNNINNPQNCSSRGTFSQIFPTVNISNLTHSSSSSLDMNLPALDLFSGSLIQPPSIDNPHFGGIFKDTTSLSSYGSTLDHMQQVGHRPTNKISSGFNSGGGTEAKRPAGSFIETTKATTQAAPPKKSRLESRASCPPFKVRKEKLGDRIAALQQLVAPFGKTDTASVLMEAIGYIKFLQNQVETLSVPYMKSSKNKTSRTMQGGSMEDGNEELQKRDLKSRGLCLVPLPCLSYVTDGGGGVWPTPNFTS